MPRRNRWRSYGNEGCLGFNPRKYISSAGGEGEPDRAGGGNTGGGGNAGSSSKRDYSRQMQLVSSGSRHACTHRKARSNNSRKGRAMRQIRRMQESAELVRINTGTEASCCRAAPESPAASVTTTEAISPSVVLSDEMSAQRDAHDDGNKGIADAADNSSAYAVYSANGAASDSQPTTPITPSHSTAKTNLFQGVKTWLKNKNNQEITVNGGMNGARNGAQIDPMNGAEDDIVTTSSPPTAPLKHKPVSSASVKFENIPAELKKKSSFCVWRREESKDGKGKMTKIPYDPLTGETAKTNDPSTFSSFASAMKACVIGGYDGIGFRVSEDIGAIDIDHCIREDGSLNDVAASVLSFFPNTYFERSPSRTGLRSFFLLPPDFAYDKSKYYIKNSKKGLEVYLPGITNRFVTVTGDVYQEGAISSDADALRAALEAFMKRKTASKTEDHGAHVSYFTDRIR